MMEYANYLANVTSQADTESIQPLISMPISATLYFPYSKSIIMGGKTVVYNPQKI